MFQRETYKIDIEHPLLSLGDEDKLTALAFSNSITGKLSLFIVNSSNTPRQINFGGEYFSNKKMFLNTNVLCNNKADPTNQKDGTKQFTDSGRMYISVPKYSISTIELSQLGQ